MGRPGRVSRAMAGGAGRAPSCPGGEAGGGEGARGAPRGGVGCRRGCPRERPCSGLWLCPCSEEDSEGHGTGVSSTAGMPASPLPRGRARFTDGVVPWLREAKPLAQGQPWRWESRQRCQPEALAVSTCCSPGAVSTCCLYLSRLPGPRRAALTSHYPAIVPSAGTTSTSTSTSPPGPSPAGLPAQAHPEPLEPVTVYTSSLFLKELLHKR